MDQLCRMIQAESDPEKFGVLIGELNDFLEKREIRLKERWANDPLGLNLEEEEKAG
ncbi:MAG TPA: hypothetical protein VJQ54_02045 [Candidatus Sulfotelmatobacter sp.]|nr:hypothetical protein [Candidatus Sulfotelmatobacter sp.]